MIIRIPEATPTNNKVMRMHYLARSKEHNRVNWLVRASIDSEETFEQCIITVTRYGNRMLDWDNMGGGLKFLLDALTHNKIIKDDNPDCIIKLNLEQAQCTRADECTEVFIEDAG